MKSVIVMILAILMYKMYKDYYICLPGKSSIWYYYNEDKNRWIEDVNGIMLRNKISTEVFDKLNDMPNIDK